MGFFARRYNYLDWWVARKVLIRSRGIWAGLCIKKKGKTMLLELLFVHTVRHLLWNMTSLLCFTRSVLSSASLFHLAGREWRAGVNIRVLRHCCQDVAAAKCPAAQSLPNRPTDPPACASSEEWRVHIQFCGRGDNWFGAGDWRGQLWATLKAGKGLHWGGLFWASGYSYYFLTGKGLFLFTQLSKNILVMN